jgi:hypothetical protein
VFESGDGPETDLRIGLGLELSEWDLYVAEPGSGMFMMEGMPASNKYR